MSIAPGASVPVTIRRRWWMPAIARGRSTIIANLAVPVLRCRRDTSGDIGSDQDAVGRNQSTPRKAGGAHVVKYFIAFLAGAGQWSGQQQDSIKSPAPSQQDSTDATEATPQITAAEKRN